MIESNKVKLISEMDKNRMESEGRINAKERSSKSHERVQDKEKVFKCVANDLLKKAI